jgi:hypothetical protein
MLQASLYTFIALYISVLVGLHSRQQKYKRSAIPHYNHYLQVLYTGNKKFFQLLRSMLF